MSKHMHLCGFLIAGPVVHSHAIWRNPAHETPFLSLDHYVRIARLLEQGCFDFLFFADRLAIADRYGDSHAAGLARGDQDATRMDPMPILGAMAAVTRHTTSPASSRRWTISPAGGRRGTSSPP